MDRCSRAVGTIPPISRKVDVLDRNHTYVWHRTVCLGQRVLDLRERVRRSV